MKTDPTSKAFNARVKARQQIDRLQQAIASDFRAHPIAYPILAEHGYMDRTSNGYKSIDGCQTIDRCRQLIATLRSV